MSKTSEGLAEQIRGAAGAIDMKGTKNHLIKNQGRKQGSVGGDMSEEEKVGRLRNNNSRPKSQDKASRKSKRKTKLLKQLELNGGDSERSDLPFDRTKSVQKKHQAGSAFVEEEEKLASPLVEKDVSVLEFDSAPQ